MGIFTAFCVSIIVLVRNYLKRVIAYSTCSQLGYIIFLCGLSNYFTSIFHLTNHAFFKALLFLSPGLIINALNDEQDMRKIGGLKHHLPFAYMLTSIGSLVGICLFIQMFSGGIASHILYFTYIFCVFNFFRIVVCCCISISNSVV